MSDPARAIGNYIRAKDGNRPFLMRQAFAADATLEMTVRTDAIAFPSSATGRDAITEVLVRRFSADYENVYTFCLAAPPAPDCRQFTCDWLVGMSNRANGDVRVGCGRYDWWFADGEPCLAARLGIVIEDMAILPSGCLDEVMTWLGVLPYPWCLASRTSAGMPASEGLEGIAEYIGRRKA